MTGEGVEDRGFAEVGQLSEADATWTVDGVASVPDGDDWVLVLGDAEDAGHWRLGALLSSLQERTRLVPGLESAQRVEAQRGERSATTSGAEGSADDGDLTVGERFAFGGRVFESGVVEGELAVRATEQVLSRVVQTIVRQSDTVIDAEIAYEDGTVEVITGTPEHPFWVPAKNDWVPLGELVEGTELHVDAGAGAILVSSTWRQGDFTVYNLEVEGTHNYFVRAPGSDAPAVLVHNICFLTTKASEAASWIALEAGAQSRKAIDAIKTRLWAGDKSVWADPVYTTMVDGKTVILDGHHRHAAATELDEAIPHQSLSAAEVVEMFGQDKLDEVYDALD